MALQLRAVVLRSDQFTDIWNDLNSGADVDVGIWRSNPPDDFFSLGDHAESGIGGVYGSRPTDTVIAVADASTEGDVGNALASPEGFELIWTDKGSGADRDVSIWRPRVPNAYVALGYMAGAGFDVQPSRDHYVCVHNSLVRQGVRGSWIWNDTGSGADSDVSLWRPAARPDLPDAIDVGTFVAIASHAKPEDDQFDNLRIGAVIEWVPQR